MPGITLDPVDAAELAEVLTFLTQWLSGRQKHALAESFAAFVGHPAYNTGTLCADLHRFVGSSRKSCQQNSGIDANVTEPIPGLGDQLASVGDE